MRVSKLVLRQFRNLEPLTLVPHPNLNLVVGLNASGKTNLCEALYYAACAQLLKGERQRELIHWNSSGCNLKLEVDGQNITIGLDAQARKKTVELDGEVVNQGALHTVFKVLAFTPDDLQIVKGSPAKRRRLLDHSLSDLDGRYRVALLAYDQVLRRKNALLRHERADEALLGVYNAQLSQRGAQLVEKRVHYLEALNAQLDTLHARLNQANKPLVLRYESPVVYERPNWVEGLKTALEQARDRERQRRVCLVGPHRDDVRFELEGVDLRRFGSQGQQKTALIALKLAQLERFKVTLGAYPVLILDDVLSELDPQRVQLLLDHLPRGLQLFLTETELSPPLLARAGKVFRVDQGRVRELTEAQPCT